MKKLIAAIALTISSVSIAQEKQWSLQECVNYALENNITVKKSELNIASNEQDIIANRGQFLPGLSANSNANLGTGSNFDPITNSRFNRTQLGLNIGVSVSQTVFNGFRTLNLFKQSKLNLERSSLELSRIKDDISLNVVNSYLNILFNQENLNVAKAQVEFSKAQLKQVQELVDAGVQPRGNLLDVEATLSNDEQRLIAAENNLKLAQLTLAQLLQLPSEGFNVDIVEVGTPSEQLLYEKSSSVYDIAVQNRWEIKSAEKQIESSNVGIKIARAGYYPSLNFSYSFGSQAIAGVWVNGEKVPSAPLGEQFDEFKAHNFSLGLNIPIFSRFQNKTSVARAKIQKENAMLDLEQAKLTLQSNIERAFTDARAALKTYVAAQKSRESQKLAFDNAQERFNIGAMNSFDLEQTRNRLINAEASLINAKYDFVFKTKVLDFYAGKSLLE